MVRRSLAIAAAGLAAVTIAVSLTGCSQHPNASPSENPSASPSASVPLRTVLQDVVRNMREKETFTGALTINAGGGTIDALEKIRLKRSGLDFDMTMHILDLGGQTQTVRMILLGDDVFLNLSPDPEQVPGRPWRKISPGDPSMQALEASLDQTRRATDPAYTIRLADAAGTLKGKSVDQVEGVPATKYSITIDFVRALAVLTDPTTHATLERLINQGVKTADYDMWISADGLPVKFVMNQTVTVPGSGRQKVQTIVTMTGWGKPVTITAPPADQIAPPSR